MRTGFALAHRPLYFLSSLGMGGLAVSFFMYLMFLVPHPDSPIPTFSDITRAYENGSPLSWGLMTFAIVAIIYFAVRHLMLLVANLRAFAEFNRSDAAEAFYTSNAGVSVMAVPLTLGMTVNVAFILGALFVPGMWDVKEYLFPVALIAVTAIAVYALRLFGRYITHVFAHRGFDIEDTNHFSQIMPAFAFAMIATGYSSSAAMSSTKIYSVIGMFGTFVFFAAAAAWILVKLPVSFSQMLRKGMAVEAGPTLWMGIPIFTLLGITTIRDGMGLTHHFLENGIAPMTWFVILGLLLAAQIVMGMFGYAVMKGQGYFATFVRGEGRSIASYGLICPGVAFAVLAMFFINWGLVVPGIVVKFSAAHIALLAVPALTQLVTIRTLWYLNRKLLGAPAAEAIPAEKQAVNA